MSLRSESPKLIGARLNRGLSAQKQGTVRPETGDCPQPSPATPGYGERGEEAKLLGRTANSTITLCKTMILFPGRDRVHKFLQGPRLVGHEADERQRMKEMVCLLKSMNKCCQLHIRLDTGLRTRTTESFAHRVAEQRFPLKVIEYGYCSVCLTQGLSYDCGTCHSEDPSSAGAWVVQK